MIKHVRRRTREEVEVKISEPVGKAKIIRIHEEKLTIETQRIPAWELEIS